jgi:glucose/arabinose dehydrogenase
MRARVCLGLIGMLAVAACDDDNNGSARPGTGPDAGAVPDAGPVPSPPVGGDVTLDLVAEGLTSPVTLVESPDNTGRLFVVDQIGVVRVVTSDGVLQDQPFLDVRDAIVTLMPDYDERGLLGLAFHPDFANNGRLFVYYTAPPRRSGWDNTSVLAEYQVTPGTPGAQAQQVALLLQEDHPQFNHNGGTLAFGPDGKLYLSIGDGGGRDDEGQGPPQQTPVFGHVDDWYPVNAGGNGQDIQQNLMGNVLRLDVSTPGTYTVPTDNPFVGRGKGEIYAYGFRNPYRFSFDMGGNHDLLLGDAGQDMWEEIDVVHRGGNYGWNVKEGTHCFSAEQPTTVPASCPSVDPTTGEALVDPVIEMFNLANPMRGTAEGLLTIVGGYVYRGQAVSQLDGRYIFGGYSTDEMNPTGAVYAAMPRSDAGLWTSERIAFSGNANGAVGHFVLGFGQDRRGEVYVLTTDSTGPMGSTGRVFRLGTAAGAR